MNHGRNHFSRLTGFACLILLALCECAPDVDRFVTSAPGPLNATLALTGTLADQVTTSATLSATSTISVALTNVTAEAASFRLANTAVFDGAPTYTFPSGPVSWTLSGGDGSKTVYVELVGRAGETTTLSASLTLDSEAPVWRSFAATATYYNDPNVTFTYDAVDDLDGDANLEIAFNPAGTASCSGLTYVPYSTGTALYTLTPPYAATYSFNACVRDRALNTAPFLPAGQSPGLGQVIYFNDQKPAAPLLNPPSTSAGSALIAWTDLTDDSVTAVVDYSTDPNFVTFATVSSSVEEQGSCLPRVVPVSSQLLTGLANLTSWYFRVHLIDCYGNQSAASVTSALIGASSTPLGNNAQHPIALFRVGNDLWAATSSVAYSAQGVNINGGSSNVASYLAGYDDDAVLFHCQTDVSNCLEQSNWSAPTSVRLGPLVENMPVSNYTAGSFDYLCQSCSPSPPIVSLAATSQRLFVFATLAGPADPQGGTGLESAVVFRSCPLISDCTDSGNWDSGVPAQVDPNSPTLTFGPPAVTVTNSEMIAGFNQLTNGSTQGHFAVARCPLSSTSDCSETSDWTVTVTDLPLSTPSVEALNGMSDKSEFMPTLNALANRPYFGLAISAAGTSACGQATTPTLVRCANGCSNIPTTCQPNGSDCGDLQLLSLDSTESACASPPDLAVSPGGIYAAWREYTGPSGAYQQQIRVSECRNGSDCSNISHFSSPVTIVTNSEQIAPSGQIVVLPKGSPASSGQRVRVLFDDAGTGQVLLAHCDSSSATCSTSEHWQLGALQTNPTGVNLALAGVNIGEQPYLLLSSALTASSHLLSESVPPPLSFSALPSIGGSTLNWLSAGASSGTLLDLAPASEPPSSLQINDVLTQSYIATTLGPETFDARSLAADGQSDASMLWLSAPFVNQSTTENNPSTTSSARGPSTLVTLPGYPYLYSLDTTASGLVLGRCALTADCGHPANFSYNTIASGTTYLESDLAIDGQRDWYWATPVPGASPRLVAIASKSDGSEQVLFCDLGSDPGQCMQGAWSQTVTLTQTFYDLYGGGEKVGPLDQPTGGAEHKPTISMNGDSIVIGHEYNAEHTFYEYGNGLYNPYPGQNLAVYYCTAATPNPHVISAAVKRGPNTDPNGDLGNISGCFTNAAAWSSTNLRNTAGGQYENDVKVLAHPIFGRLLVDAQNSYDYNQTTSSSTALTFYACPYFSGSGDSLTPTDCSDGNGTELPQNWMSVSLDIGAGTISSLGMTATSEYRGPLVFPDESTAYTIVTYASQENTSSWMMAVCAAAADPSFQTAWPCLAGANWNVFSLAAVATPPVASSVHVVGSDIVAMFLEQDNLYMATCALGQGCDTASGWNVTTVATSSSFAGFVSGFSQGRSVSFFSADPNGGLIVDHSLGQPAGPSTFSVNRLTGGFGTIVQGP